MNEYYDPSPVTVTATRYELRRAAQAAAQAQAPEAAELKAAADSHPLSGSAYPVTLTPQAILRLDQASAALRAELTDDRPALSPAALIIGYLISPDPTP